MIRRHSVAWEMWASRDRKISSSGRSPCLAAGCLWRFRFGFPAPPSSLAVTSCLDLVDRRPFLRLPRLDRLLAPEPRREPPSLSCPSPPLPPPSSPAESASLSSDSSYTSSSGWGRPSAAAAETAALEMTAPSTPPITFRFALSGCSCSSFSIICLISASPSSAPRLDSNAWQQHSWL